MTTSYKYKTPLQRLYKSICISLCLACAVIAVAQHPVVARTPNARINTRPASLNELYTMFFHYAVHVKTLSDAEAAKGKEISFFRDHLQKASGMSPNDYNAILESAQRFVATTHSAQTQMAQMQQGKIYGARNVSIPDQGLTQSGIAPANRVEPTQSDALTQREFIRASRASLQQAIKEIRQTLGQDRAQQFEAYLKHDYVAPNIGQQSGANQLNPIITKDNLLKSENITPDNTVIDPGYSCDDGDYVCSDVQSSYTGNNGDIDLYAYAAIGEGALDDDADGDIFIYEMDDDGYLSINDEYPDNECSTYSTAVDFVIDCDGIESFRAPTSYVWEADSTLYWWDYDDQQYEDQNGDKEQEVSISEPDINTITPDTVTPGSSGTFLVDGEGFESPFGNEPTVTVSSQGTIFSSFYLDSFDANAGTLTVAYSVASSPPFGPQTVTVNNGFGTGEDIITITAPPPTITSITVQGSVSDALQAGETQTVLLTGKNFGNSTPNISVGSGSGYVSVVPGTTSGSTNSVTFEVSTLLAAPQVPASFVVQVNDDANPDTAVSPEVLIIPYTPPPPNIYDGLSSANSCQGYPISNSAGGDNTQEVYVGQLVQFTGCIPSNIPQTLSVTSMGWEVINDPNFLSESASDFIPSANPAPYIAMNLPSCGTQTACDFGKKFYFLTQGTYNFTFTYQLSNGTSSSATVTYQVTGPIGIASSETSTTFDYYPQQTVCGVGYYMCAVIGESMFFYPDSSNPKFLRAQGTEVFSHATTPTNNTGSYQFIQTLYPRLSRFRDATGTPTCTAIAGLDNVYPFPGTAETQGNSILEDTSDQPAIPLSAPYCNQNDTTIVEASDSFGATMYLLWDPELDLTGASTPNCSASESYDQFGFPGTPKATTCTGSIPAPLGSMTWGYCGSAINTLVPASPWVLNCNANVDIPLIPQYSDATTFNTAPHWAAVSNDQQ